MPQRVLAALLTRDNGYPLDFKIDHAIEDSTDGKYFPATLSHIVIIRNWTDDELAQNLASYKNELERRNTRAHPSVTELIIALRMIASDESERRAKFREGKITLEQYKPMVYIGNIPKITRQTGEI